MSADEPVPKRKPGRPRKTPLPEEEPGLEANGFAADVKEEGEEPVAQPKKPRGRPRKHPLPDPLDPPVKRPRGRPPGTFF